MSPSRRHLVLALAATAALAAGLGAGVEPAVAQDQPPQGAAREAMWRAPTDEDWAKPVLITFQRSWDDAVAVSKETGKALLVCVNMDGEIASEHYAGVRYRQPDITQLYAPYVCVIASVYRHTTKDYDEQGRRVLCPRFGSVTCGEHISIEPLLFEKFLKPDRVAPRHVMVELDGSETYDIYYANDTASVFKAIEDGIAGRTTPTRDIVRGDRPITERVGSRDIEDRRAVEAAYRQGDQDARRALLDAARTNPAADPVELLRLAVFGFDPELSKVARAALAETQSPAATDVIAEALRVPMDATEREALLAALERLGSSSRRAQWLAVVHRGLSGKSGEIDVTGWAEALGAAAESRAGSGSYAPPSDWFVLEAKQTAQAAICRARPDDGPARVELALASLALAFEAPRTFRNDTRTARMFERHMFDEARSAAREAERLGVDDWRTTGVLALASYYGGETDAAYPLAESAVKRMPPGEPSWNAMAIVTIYAESRFKAIKAAVRAKEKWPPQWLTDLHAAYSVLLQHPLGTADQVVWHYDFLDWLRAYHRASRVLSEGLARFPSSSVLHNRHRTLVLRQKGPEGLQAAYDAMLAAQEPAADLHWFAGYASSVAAEFHRRARGVDKAMASYERSIRHFDAAIEANAESKASADHYAAFAHAGRSRLAYQQDDDTLALAEIVASFTRSPATAGSRDGMGFTPAETGQMLLARLQEREKTAEAIVLQDALGQLDPEFLRPDRP